MAEKKVLKENNQNETKAEETLGTLMVIQILITIALIVFCIIYSSNVKSGFMGGFSEDDETLTYFMFIGSSFLSSLFMIGGYLRKDKEFSIIGTIIFAFFPFLIVFSDLPNLTKIRTIISIILAIYCIIALTAELLVPKKKNK